jgi:hypothetical protein
MDEVNEERAKGLAEVAKEKADLHRETHRARQRRIPLHDISADPAAFAGYVL